MVCDAIWFLSNELCFLSPSWIKIISQTMGDSFYHTMWYKKNYHMSSITLISRKTCDKLYVQYPINTFIFVVVHQFWVQILSVQIWKFMHFPPTDLQQKLCCRSTGGLKSASSFWNSSNVKKSWNCTFILTPRQSSLCCKLHRTSPYF
jgi:hypothetical protein